MPPTRLGLASTSTGLMRCTFVVFRNLGMTGPTPPHTAGTFSRTFWKAGRGLPRSSRAWGRADSRRKTPPPGLVHVARQGYRRAAGCAALSPPSLRAAERRGGFAFGHLDRFSGPPRRRSQLGLQIARKSGAPTGKQQTEKRVLLPRLAGAGRGVKRHAPRHRTALTRNDRRHRAPAASVSNIAMSATNISPFSRPPPRPHRGTSATTAHAVLAATQCSPSDSNAVSAVSRRRWADVRRHVAAVAGALSARRRPTRASVPRGAARGGGASDGVVAARPTQRPRALAAAGGGRDTPTPSCRVGRRRGLLGGAAPRLAICTRRQSRAAPAQTPLTA